LGNVLNKIVASKARSFKYPAPEMSLYISQTDYLKPLYLRWVDLFHQLEGRESRDEVVRRFTSILELKERNCRHGSPSRYDTRLALGSSPSFPLSVFYLDEL